jgi:hypothetical protein
MRSLGIGYFNPIELSPTSASAPFRQAFYQIPRELESRRVDSNRFPAHYECAARYLGATEGLTGRTAATSP